MAFATRTLRDTVVTQEASGGIVTVLVNIDDDTTATNAILDASALDGHANGAKLHIKRLWWGLVQELLMMIQVMLQLLNKVHLQM